MGAIICICIWIPILLTVTVVALALRDRAATGVANPPAGAEQVVAAPAVHERQLIAVRAVAPVAARREEGPRPPLGRQQGIAPWSRQELARLSFARWLYQTGRLGR